MSSEHLVYDVEKGSNVIVVRDPPHKESHWKCLSICSFLLLIGAVTVFTLLQFKAFGTSENQDSIGSGNPFPEGMPQTLKVQAVTSGKPAIHAIASRTHKNNLIWITDLAPAMTKNGMRLDKKENVLVVPSSGLYFVYSQLLFHGESCSGHTQNSLLLTHKIFRRSKEYSGEDVELMKAVKSVCDGGNVSPDLNKLWFESIYQGGVFLLQEGDKLGSNTESAQYLNWDREGQVYFGAIALD
ncbi:tumor necrosis factor [Eublepharis macularius]|uniref:Tumor necrosis factor n=1 Tax=Eublepharis macularius TaxID=481883 RepID=A0AA97J9J7_EUBMA|nr:tumor necrosis factor [Eublepharis macularius]